MQSRGLNFEALQTFGVQIANSKNTRSGYWSYPYERWDPSTQQAISQGFQKKRMFDFDLQQKQRPKYQYGHPGPKGYFGLQKALNAVQSVQQNGANNCPARRTLIITEGEIDAMSVYATTSQDYHDTDSSLSTISVANGANENFHHHPEEHAFCSLFDQILIWFDSDQAGYMGAKNLAAAIKENNIGGTKVTIINPERDCFSEPTKCKDANDYLRREPHMISAILRYYLQSPSKLPESFDQPTPQPNKRQLQNVFLNAVAAAKSVKDLFPKNTETDASGMPLTVSELASSSRHGANCILQGHTKGQPHRLPKYIRKIMKKDKQEVKNAMLVQQKADQNAAIPCHSEPIPPLVVPLSIIPSSNNLHIPPPTNSTRSLNHFADAPAPRILKNLSTADLRLIVHAEQHKRMVFSPSLRQNDTQSHVSMKLKRATAVLPLPPFPDYAPAPPLRPRIFPQNQIRDCRASNSNLGPPPAAPPTVSFSPSSYQVDGYCAAKSTNFDVNWFFWLSDTLQNIANSLIQISQQLISVSNA